MKGIRFYLEYQNTYHKRKDWRTRSVIAVLAANGQNDYGFYDAIAATHEGDDCPVRSTTVHPAHLWSRCKRISEQEARQIHPQLFIRLDNDNKRETERTLSQ